MKTQNIFQNIPQNLPEELFEDILKRDNFKIERIVSDGHTSPKKGWYNSTQNEWVIVLQGEAILSFEKELHVELQKGDYYNILAGQKHRVSYTSESEKTIWLAIYY